MICSDVLCYRGDLTATRVKNRFRDWVDAIRMHLADLDATAAAGDALREQVLGNWMLEGTTSRAGAPPGCRTDRKSPTNGVAKG